MAKWPDSIDQRCELPVRGAQMREGFFCVEWELAAASFLVNHTEEVYRRLPEIARGIRISSSVLISYQHSLRG